MSGTSAEEDGDNNKEEVADGWMNMKIAKIFKI